MSSLVDGLTPRPPTEHIARLSADPLGDAFLHTIDRESGEKLSVVVTDGDLRVFDLIDGTEKTVNFPSGKAYLDTLSGTARSAFSCTTLADFTFVTNRQQAVTATNAGEAHDNTFYVYVKQVSFNCNYGVYIDGVLKASMTVAPNGTYGQTESIASQLTTTLQSALGHPTTWTVERQDSIIILKHVADPTAAHTIRAWDSMGDTGITAWNKSIQNFEDLPRFGVDGCVVEVTGSSSNAFDSYYVKYNGAKGQWEETYKPEHRERPTPATMPHKLTKEIDGTFTFDVIDWGWRAAGDADSNPSPSVIGRTINDVFIFRNRLTLLSDQNSVSSQAGGENFFDFYASTATTQLDSDPVDVAINSANSAKVPLARYGVPFADDLLIFTDPGQFKLGAGDQVFTNQTAKVSQVADYAAQLTARPVTNGELIHFAIEKGGDSGIREGFIADDTSKFKATDITIHVPTYLKGMVTKLLSLTNRDTLLVQTADAPNKIGVYTWYIENNEKLQSSWSYWALEDDAVILDMSYIEGAIHLLVQRDAGVFLEKMRLDASLTDPGLPFNSRLDRKVYVSGTYDADNDRTTWTIPYDLTGVPVVGMYGAGVTGAKGFAMPALTVVNAAAGTVRLMGNHTTQPCAFGIKFTRRYQPTRPAPPASQGGKGTMTDGRLQLRHLFFNHSNAGHYVVAISNPARDDKVYTFTANTVGQITLGEANLATGRFRVPCRGHNDKVTIEIRSDSHLPCSILSFDWEGEFTLRSRRL